MKFISQKFDDYIQETGKNNLHPNLVDIFAKFPKQLDKLQNIIFFGPPGVGKYSQSLQAIKKYSQTELKFERNMIITFDKLQYTFKISDVHIEIDMALLGVKSKPLWHEIYQQIVDICLRRNSSFGIILCKNMQDIHSELLENFYSYMQQTPMTTITIKFVFLTEEISFLPDSILNSCKCIPIARPSKETYNTCLLPHGKYLPPCANVSDIHNSKYLFANIEHIQPFALISDKIVETIMNPNDMKFTKLRIDLYSILTYNIDVTDVIWSVIRQLDFDNAKMHKILRKLYTGFKFYNNNYRPIFHLEQFIYTLIVYYNNYV